MDSYIPYIREQIIARVTSSTQMNALIMSLVSDAVINKYINKGVNHTIDQITDIYYRFKDIYISGGGLSEEQLGRISQGEDVYTVIDEINDEIIRLFKREPILF